MKYLILCGAVLFLPSIAMASTAPDPNYYSQLSTGSIGCPAEQIQTYNFKNTRNWTEDQETWMAQCNGKTYYCSDLYSSAIVSVNCAAAQM